MTRLVPVAFFAVASLTAGGLEQGSGAAKDEKLLAELQQALATAWVTADRATIERIIAPDWRSTGPDGRMTDRARVMADVFQTRQL